VGAGIGAPLRYAIDKVARARSEFPLGILFVNVVGSFILGISHQLLCHGFLWRVYNLDLHLHLILITKIKKAQQSI
jgi:fluoride ion exporter CrcB/FEX